MLPDPSELRAGTDIKLLDAIVALTASVDRLNTRISGLSSPVTKPESAPPEATEVANLLRAVVAWNGGSDVAFSALDLIAKCAVDPVLAAALEACIGDFSTRKVGMLLARYKGIEIEGLRIERCDKSRLWSVRICLHL